MSFYIRHIAVIYLRMHLALCNFLDQIETEKQSVSSPVFEIYVTRLSDQRSLPREEGKNAFTTPPYSNSLEDEFWGNETLQNNVKYPEIEVTKEENEYNTTDIIPIKFKVTKCCQENEFYNTDINECTVTTDSLKFIDQVLKFVNVSMSLVNIFSRKIENCPDTRTAEMNDYSDYHILENGEIHDQSTDKVYGNTEYCLEMVGVDSVNSSLVLIYCSENRNVIPKCCPFENFYNTLENDCTSYLDFDTQTDDSLLYAYLNENSELSMSNLVCSEPPMFVNMNETYLKESYLCLKKNELCFSWDKYCFDNMLQNGTNELIQGSFLCPELFVKKCCPEGEGIDDTGCVKLNSHSLFISEMLSNSMYHVSAVINYDNSECNPVFIFNNDESDISWMIDKDGSAIVNREDGLIYTNKFCVEDYATINESIPVLKACSEEVKEFIPVSSLETYPENVLGKCCPPSQNMIYIAQTGKCVDYSKNTSDYLDNSEIKRFNISDLLFTGFPKCQGNDKYHAYILGANSTNDYVEIVDKRKLQITNIIDHCKTKETIITESMYCLEYTDYHAPGNEYKLHAFVCITEQKNIHSEKSFIVISLVGLSCAALVASFLVLMCMRVRRGMITVRKVNTLAGRILMSYVFSLLIGYLSLGVSYLADFGENHGKCVVLTGFLQFFMMAAFCWNTSICLEGFLLTIDIKASERRRYIYHSLGAWGIPGCITALTLLIDFYSEHLPCGVVTPRIGLERCFFSNNTALLLYFYLPITITVLTNGVLLVASKILRLVQLKKLENNMEALKEQGSGKQREGEKQSTSSKASGLRTHQTKNMWMEYFRLVVWSGGTWLMEVVGILVTMFSGVSGGEWYNYLWYLPVSFNCLRGLGIFFLIMSTSEYISKLEKLFCTLNCWSKSKRSSNGRELESHRLRKSYASEDMESFNRNDDNDRKLSSTTVISDITIDSSVHNESADPNCPKLYRSISQAALE